MNAASSALLDARLAGHGGRLCIARALHPKAPQPWIDLSTGINPKPYPAPRASASARARLPELQQLRALEETAAQAFGVKDPSRVVAVAGSEAALRLMPYVLRADRAVVAGPTYASHEEAWRTAGIGVKQAIPFDHAWPSPLPAAGEVDALAAGEGKEAEFGRLSPALPSPCPSPGTGRGDVPLGAVAFAELPQAKEDPQGQPEEATHRTVFTVVNPNNPDGVVLQRNRLLALHDELAHHDGYLVVDEAFADAEPACSVASFAGSTRQARLLVLRSFGKFYGLAGLRLGFVIAAPDLAQRLRSLLGDWPVTADAMVAGLAAYADTSWAERTRARLRDAARSLDALLVRHGFTIVGGTSLFRLARCADARRHFERLLSNGILVRPFDHDATLLRFGLPYGAPAWQRLTRALETAT